MSNELENMNQAQRILNAALNCIASKGYANVSLRDIADEAGVVLSQLSYYYKNKEGLFIEIIKVLTQQYLREVEEILKRGRTEKERISLLIEYFQETLREDSELFKLIFDLSSMALWSDSLRELQNDLFNSATNLIEKYISNEFSNKEKFKHGSSIALSRIILGTLLGTSIQVIMAHEKEDMIDSLSILKVLFE